MSVTIHDVAKLAGVSHTTVSWAIHGHPDISDATKAKVFRAIEELDYHPNFLARSLVRGKTNTIAIVAPFFSSPFEMEILKGIEQCAPGKKDDYSITLFSSIDRSEKVLKEIVQGKRADALILLSVSPSPETINLYRDNGVPLLVIDEAASGVTEIQLNNFRGAYMAADFLVKSGRKRIALVTGDGDKPGLSQRERRNGFLQALADNGIEFDERLAFRISNYYFEEGQTLLQPLIDEGCDADAVFCAAGDIIAMGIMLEARLRGIPVPERLAVVGYDDIPSSALVYPPLTTVRQPLLDIGRAAYGEIVRCLKEGNQEARSFVYEPELIVRESV